MEIYLVLEIKYLTTLVENKYLPTLNLSIVERCDELMKVDSTTTQLERTNLLMKLRETLTHNDGENGTSVTYPDGNKTI